MPVDEINDPTGYWGGWLAIGIGMFVLAVAVVLVIVLTTRGPKAPAAPKPLRRGEDPYGALRAEAIGKIDALAAEHGTGHLDDRALHLGLSSVMRSFASGRLGKDTRSLTLLEISRRQDAGPLTELIRHYYRPSFADDEELRLRPGLDPAESIRLARTVVTTW